MTHDDMFAGWDTTDSSDEEVVVRVQEKGEVEMEPTATLSRKPAAIFGMLVVSGLGIAFFNGLPPLQGEVLESTVSVEITNNGLKPDSIQVERGESIEWINQQIIPHILESETLCNADDECLYTPTIFNGESVVFEISEDIPNGTYTYTSATSSDITGEIVVTGNEPPALAIEATEVTTPEITKDVENETAPEIPVLEAIEPTPQKTASIKPATEKPTPVVSTPVVEKQKTIQPPVASISQQTKPPVNTHAAAPVRNPVSVPVNAQALHSGAPKPFTQPRTGMGEWVVLFLSLGVFALWIRSALRGF